jgi:hypothetical protein
MFGWMAAWFLERRGRSRPRTSESIPSTASSTGRANPGCDCDLSLGASQQTLQDVLDRQAITLNSASDKLFKLIASGDMAGDLICQSKNDPVGGPFLLLAKFSWDDRQKYAALLKEFSGDDALSDLFEPQGPVYLQIVRCRPGQWKDLSRCLGDALNQQDQTPALLQ